ncbi:MAG: ATP-dependent metallopeptidase FtsH/Yme1/Tma family protein, partial [Terricaulis sp.]
MPIRTLLIWGAIALVLVVLFAAMNGGNNPLRNAQELPYSTLLDRVESGSIGGVTTQADTIIATSKDGKQTFVTYLPTGTMA